MKILLIPDKFKGSLAAEEVISAMIKGINSAQPEAETHSIIASDGGDGFLNAISANINSEKVTVDTVDPLGREIMAEYLYNVVEQVAYIELAKASGLTLLKEEERSAMQTSTLGTGLLIKDAILKGSKSIYIGLGGSASNDAGLGIAEALGYYFLDNDGNQLAPIGSNLSKINSIHKSSNSISLKDVSFFALNDVENPLFGPNGAAHTYAEQKGASIQEITILDHGLQDLSNVVKQQTGKNLADCSGAGAAGGTAYGLKIFCEAEFISGIDFVLNISGIDELLNQKTFDYIITGEGKFDSQTLNGKLVKGVIDLGKKYKTPIIAFCGQLGLDKKELEKFDQLTVLEIKDDSRSLDYNMKNAAMLLEKSIKSIFKR